MRFIHDDTHDRASMSRHVQPVAFIGLLLVFLWSGCRVNVIAHDPDNALAEANAVLTLLYLTEDYTKAYGRLAAEARQRHNLSSLRQQVTEMNRRYGRLVELHADSFLLTPGQRSIVIFYKGIHSNGVSYHRLVVARDGSGYKVSGLWIADQPYPQDRLRRAFNREIVIK